jgi:opacity protein-like surface antigen
MKLLTRLLGLAGIPILMMALPSQSFADRAGKMDAGFLITYVYGQDIDFEGGARAELNSDPGFGFGFAYNYNNKLAARFDTTFNSISYDASRVNAAGERIQAFGSELETFSLRFGGDYNFLEGKTTPFVNASIGWSFADTNVPDGPPDTVCWWDPWFGYYCSGYQSTHTEDTFTYGVGAGVRFDVFQSSYVKLGYYIDFMDFDKASGSADFDALRFEIGASY